MTDTSGENGAAPSVEAPDPELVERAKRRRFPAEYKLSVLREADACTRPGEIGERLRREELYTSHLTVWRKQRDDGALVALSRKRGPKARNPRDKEIAGLRRRLERLETELAKAREVIEVHGKPSALLGELLAPKGASGNTER